MTKRQPAPAHDKGDLIANRYLLLRALSLGTTADVYEALHLGLGKSFALKLLHPSVVTTVSTRERFARRALRLMGTRSAHVVRVIDVGADPGCCFLAAELLYGRNLAQELSGDGPLAVDDAVTFVLHAILGLRAAHATGLVHRDLRAANVYVADHPRERVAKLLGFGLTLDPLDVEASPLAHVAPERLDGERPADGRTDVWALGLMLSELLTGVQPFERDDAKSTRRAVLEFDPRPLDLVRPDVPAGLALIVQRALMKNPDERYADVSELGVALSPFGHPELIVPAPPPTSLIREVARRST